MKLVMHYHSYRRESAGLAASIHLGSQTLLLTPRLRIKEWIERYVLRNRNQKK